MVEWMEITFRNEKFSELKYEMLTIRKSSLAKFFKVSLVLLYYGQSSMICFSSNFVFTPSQCIRNQISNKFLFHCYNLLFSSWYSQTLKFLGVKYIEYYYYYYLQVRKSNARNCTSRQARASLELHVQIWERGMSYFQIHRPS